MKLLKIADGTPNVVTVWDVRDDYEWTAHEWELGPGPHRAIIYHHTADQRMAETADHQLRVMRAMADADTFGLPYNFLVWPSDFPRVFYVNDIDRAQPHTFNWNDATAIALQGNYQVSHVPAGAMARIYRLTLALESMWGRALPHHCHRDLGATLCPGVNMVNALRMFNLIGK